MTDVGGEGPILFFDGICHLCDTAVDFLLVRDRSGRLRYAPLQGSTAARLLPEADRTSLDTVVLLENGVLYRRSSALLRATTKTKGPWSWAARIALVVPRPLRDLVYDVVAKNRYKWFGTRSTCRLPTKEERGRLLE